MVMAFLKQQSFAVMDWPGNSPGFYLADNLRGLMKVICKKKGKISLLPLLIEVIKELWTTLPKSFMLKLAHTMPTRIKQCLENAG
jgi:hypothetical protein